MRVIVFGATGPTGAQVVGRALEAGHHVTAFARDPRRVTVHHENLRVAMGDALDPPAVEDAMAGQDAAIVALGARNRSGTSAPPRDLDSRATRHIVAGMKRHGARRLVVQSSVGVGDSRDFPGLRPFFLMHVLVPFLLAEQWKAKNAQEQLVRESGLDWVLVRPVSLYNGRSRGQVQVSLDGSPVPTRIARADVASFLVRQLTSDDLLGQAPVIGG